VSWQLDRVTCQRQHKTDQRWGGTGYLWPVDDVSNIDNSKKRKLGKIGINGLYNDSE
jgi:hypothetical protein